MTYEDLQNMFETQAQFSVATDGVNWEADWNSNEFADDNLPNLLAVDGEITLKHSSGWTDDHYEEAYTNPTWMDVMKFLDVAMDEVDDHHHMFLEGISDDGKLYVGS